jgi:uncharacterized RDD family membrane protein YckC
MTTRRIIDWILVTLESAALVFWIRVLQFTLSEEGKVALKDNNAENADLAFYALIGFTILAGIIAYRSLIRANSPSQAVLISGKTIATVRSRILASIGDAVITLPIAAGGYFVSPGHPNIMLTLLILTHLLFFYDFLSDWRTGQTLAKKVLKIRVCTETDDKLSVLQAGVRISLYAVPSIFSVLILALNYSQIQNSGTLSLS